MQHENWLDHLNRIFTALSYYFNITQPELTVKYQQAMNYFAQQLLICCQYKQTLESLDQEFINLNAMSATTTNVRMIQNSYTASPPQPTNVASQPSNYGMNWTA